MMEFKCNKCICKKCEEHKYGRCDSCNYCVNKPVVKCDDYEQYKEE